jgi:hypothetical protein
MYRAKEQKNTNSRPNVTYTPHSFGKSIPFDQIEKLDNRSL